MKPNPVKELLVAVRERISDIKHWTRGADARDRADYPVRAESIRAYCWCLSGAIRVEVGTYTPNFEINRALSRLLNQAAYDQIGHGYVEFNDSRNHADVLKLLDDVAATLPDEVADDWQPTK